MNAAPRSVRVSRVIRARADQLFRFYSMIAGMTVKNLLVDGDRACALTHYQLQPSGRPAFESDVAEVFVVKNGRIVTFDIYFDSAPFPR